MAKIAVIGTGFSGLSAACYLSDAGHEVHVFEKNEDPGGRARQFKTKEGFVFDMGPSWYWMPDVFERFFNDFGYTVADFYTLRLLDPSFEMVFENQESMIIPAAFEELCNLFESVEKGSAIQLRKILNEAERKYRLAMDGIIYQPGLSVAEFLSADFIRKGLTADIFLSFSKHIRKYFRHPKILTLLEFPVLFLGAKPSQIPALYSLMNYAALKLGTWYPEGGFGAVVDAMVKIARSNNATFHFESEVTKIISHNGGVTALEINGSVFECDGVIAAADYQHVESKLLDSNHRNYGESYWEKKTFAPSALIFYLGLNKRISRLQHHTLFFDEDFDDHIRDIYDQPRWPGKPLFYCCCPSKTDHSVAPPGHENLFLLIPIAPGLPDDDIVRETYFKRLLQRIEKFTGENIEPHIVYKRSYCVRDFISDYNSYKGNAYGLANTISQTAHLKPKVKNYGLKNLFYAGQLTVPGPGVPPSIISGKIASGLLHKYLGKAKNEVVV